MVFLHQINKQLMVMAVTTTKSLSESRHSRILNAREYARKIGRKPLTVEQHKEFMKMVAEFTNL